MGMHLRVKFEQPELKGFRVLFDDMQNWVNHSNQPVTFKNRSRSLSLIWLRSYMRMPFSVMFEHPGLKTSQYIYIDDKQKLCESFKSLCDLEK